MRCAVYARVSTDMEVQKTSIAHQINYFQKYIADKGWQLYKVYQDIESGTRIQNRQGLQQLVHDAKKNCFDVILTKSISRFARNTLEGLQIIRDLKAKRIRFITIEDGFDSEEYDEFMFTLLLSIAQKESEKMSQRIRFGKLCRAKNGYYNGSLPPYGYQRIDKHTIVPARDISKYVVQKIFTMYLEGKGVYKIAKELNEKGYPTPSQRAGKDSGCVWHQSTVRKILSNSFYVGDLIQNKTITGDVLTGERIKNKKEDYVYVKETHQAIIDRETFEEVQRQLEKRKREKHGVYVHLFSNLLFCGICGSGMHFKKGKGTYICGKMNKMGKKACAGTSIKEEELKGIIINELKKMIESHLDKTRFLADIQREWYAAHAHEDLKEIEGLLQKSEGKKAKLVNMMLENMIDAQMFKKKMKELENEWMMLYKRKLEVENKKAITQKQQMKKMEQILALEEIDHGFLQKMIHHIILRKDKKIEISYNFKV